MATVGHLILSCLLVLMTEAAQEFDMSKSQGCDLTGYIDVPSGGSVTLTALPADDVPPRCTIDLRAENDNDKLKLTFVKQEILNCNVDMVIRSKTKLLHTITCNTPQKEPLELGVREINIRILRPRVNAREYNIKMSVSTYRPEPGAGASSGGAALDTGTIVGIVAGAMVLLVIIAIIVLCCHRKRKKPSDDSKAMLKRKEANQRQGVNNSVVKNGNSPPASLDNKLAAHELPASPRSGALLGDFSDKKFVYDVENARNTRVLRGDKVQNSNPHERSVDEPRTNSGNRGNPTLDDLKTNPRFRDTFTHNDFDDRTQRIKNGYHDEDGAIVAPPLPMAPKSPGITRRNNYAGIQRAPRLTSSAEEIQQLGVPLEERGDVNIQLIPESPNERGSLGEVVPIRLETSGAGENKHRNNSYLDREEFDENIPSELSYEDEKYREDGKPRHTLRPNRGRSDRKKDADAAKSKSTDTDANKAKDNQRKKKKVPTATLR